MGMFKKQQVLLVLSVFSSCCHASAQQFPENIANQLPKDQEAILIATGDFDEDRATDYLIVTGAKSERLKISSGEPAPKRWLFAFINTGAGRFALSGKNADIAFAADYGMQCDPLLDSGGVVTKGPYFTVENSEACGAHWTDYITFRYEKQNGRFVFHKRIVEAWVLNGSIKPDAPALIRNSRKVTTMDRTKPILLDDYSPSGSTKSSR
jgi:hypothetical protein